MHGMIFAELKKYVDTRLGHKAWENLLAEAGMGGRIFLAVATYADAEALTIVTTASRLTKKEPAVILEDFGEFITPDLMKMYGALARPEWKTLEFLENIEGTIHRVVRIRNKGATPPQIRCARTAPMEVTISYGSARKLCALAKGLVYGVARHFGEDIKIAEPRCMLRGAPSCTLVVQLQNQPA